MSKRALRIIIEDRAIAYHPYLARVMDSVAGGVWLSQLLYWDSVKAMDETWDGWFFKTDAEIIGETCVSVRESRSAKEQARKLGIIETERRGMPARTFYHVDIDRIVELVEQVCTTPANKLVRHRTNKIVQNPSQILPQSTTESTTDISPNGEKVIDEQTPSAIEFDALPSQSKKIAPLIGQGGAGVADAHLSRKERVEKVAVNLSTVLYGHSRYTGFEKKTAGAIVDKGYDDAHLVELCIHRQAHPYSAYTDKASGKLKEPNAQWIFNEYETWRAKNYPPLNGYEQPQNDLSLFVGAKK